MKRAELIRQIEELTEHEYHSFLAGCDKHVKLVADSLRKAKAEGERKTELGEDNATIRSFTDAGEAVDAGH